MRIERDAERTGLHHPTKGFFAQLGMVKMQGKGRGGLARPAIGNPDAKNGAGGHGQPFPDAGGIQ